MKLKSFVPKLVLSRKSKTNQYINATSSYAMFLSISLPLFASHDSFGNFADVRAEMPGLDGMSCRTGCVILG